MKHPCKLVRANTDEQPSASYELGGAKLCVFHPLDKER